MTPAQQLIVDTVRSYVGCSLKNRRDELVRATGTIEVPPPGALMHYSNEGNWFLILEIKDAQRNPNP